MVTTQSPSRPLSLAFLLPSLPLVHARQHYSAASATAPRPSSLTASRFLRPLPLYVRAARLRCPPTSLPLPLPPRASADGGGAGSGSNQQQLAEDMVQAAMLGETPTVARALAEGVSPSFTSSRGEMTALMWACAEGHLDIVELLLDASVDVNARNATSGMSALLYAVENLRTTNPLEPLPPGFPGRDMLLSALSSATSSSGSSPSVPPQMSMDPKLSDHPAIIRMLIDRGADIRIRNSFDETLLHLATRKAQDGIVRDLLARGLDVNARSLGAQETPLHLAAKESHLDVVNLLCELGADIEAKSRFGWTPLMWAAACGWEDVVAALIARGADVNVQASYNYEITSPLKEARRCARPASVCKLLISAGARE